MYLRLGVSAALRVPPEQRAGRPLRLPGGLIVTILFVAGLLALNAAVPYAAYKFSVKLQEGVWKA